MITTERKEKITKDLVRFLKQKGWFHDIVIYVNGQAWYSEPHRNMQKIRLTEDLAYWMTAYPEKPFECANMDLISISFEGPMYHAINYGNGMEQLDKFLSKYNLWHELGHAWTASIYEEP